MPTAREMTGTKMVTDDPGMDVTLRPARLSEYVGQEPIKEKLVIFIAAAKQRRESLDHTLFFGPPGLGKTTLATIIAHEMDVPLTSTSGPAIERPGDLAAVLTNLEPHSVLFIDEIHRLNRTIEEILYPAMEDFKLDILIGQGPGARTIKLDLPPFTLVGATTRAGALTSPLRDRFGIVERLNFYHQDELVKIAQRSARIMNIATEDAGLLEIARRSRGTPRIVNRLLRRVRDFAQVRSDGKISVAVADAALSLLTVDRRGFDDMDRRLLRTLIEKYDGGPVGIETLASSMQEESQTVEDVLEPFLIQEGLINRTPRGRIATRLAYEHLGLATLMKKATKNQQEMF